MSQKNRSRLRAMLTRSAQSLDPIARVLGDRAQARSNITKKIQQDVDLNAAMLARANQELLRQRADQRVQQEQIDIDARMKRGLVPYETAFVNNQKVKVLMNLLDAETKSVLEDDHLGSLNVLNKVIKVTDPTSGGESFVFLNDKQRAQLMESVNSLDDHLSNVSQVLRRRRDKDHVAKVLNRLENIRSNLTGKKDAPASASSSAPASVASRSDGESEGKGSDPDSSAEKGDSSIRKRIANIAKEVARNSPTAKKKKKLSNLKLKKKRTKK